MWYNNNIDKFIVLVQQNIILETVFKDGVWIF